MDGSEHPAGAGPLTDGEGRAMLWDSPDSEQVTVAPWCSRKEGSRPGLDGDALIGSIRTPARAPMARPRERRRRKASRTDGRTGAGARTRPIF